MRGRIATIVLICATAVAPANARLVSATGMSGRGFCRVVAGEKMLARAGGAAALCYEVEHAVHAVAPKAKYKAEIKVLPRSRLSATLVVNGRSLPDQKFAVMDDELSRDSVHRFAEGIATAVAEAAKP